MVGSEVSSVAYDIFISYRRQDAEAHACMLYRDLVNAGYTVFFDHKTLGAGDFIDNIHHAIDSSTDFLLLLSHDGWPVAPSGADDGEHHQERDRVLRAAGDADDHRRQCYRWGRQLCTDGEQGRHLHFDCCCIPSALREPELQQVLKPGV